MSDIPSKAVQEAATKAKPKVGGPFSARGGTLLSTQLPLRATLFPISGSELATFTPEFISLADKKQMRRDAIIALGLTALKAPLMNANRYYLQGGDDRARALVQAVLMPHLNRLLEKVLLALDFGFQAIEIAWKVDAVAHIDDDGRKFTFRSVYVPDGFLDLDPEKVEILVDKRTGRYAGVEHNVQRLGVLNTLLATYQDEFGNLYGNSVLDPAWVFWKYAAIIRKLWGRFMERFALGSYVGFAPAETREDENGNKQNPVKVLSALLANLLGAGVTGLPFEPDPQSGRNMWDVKLLESTREGRTFAEAMSYFESAKLRAILVPERVLTQDTAVGSHSMAESHSETFFVMSCLCSTGKSFR